MNLDKLKQELVDLFNTKMVTVIGVYYSMCLMGPAIDNIRAGGFPHVVLGLLLGYASFRAFSYFYDKLNVR